MFRKIYKEANNSIHGDRAVLDRAFEMAEKPAEKKSNILKYSFIGTAAAAVLVAGAVFINYDLLKLPTEDVSQGTETAESVPFSEEISYDAITPTEAAAPKESRTVKAEKKSSSAANAEDKHEERAQREDASAADYAVENNGDTSEELPTLEASAEITASGSSAALYGRNNAQTDSNEAWDDFSEDAGIMVMSDNMAENSDRSVISYTSQEYYNYIGIDFSKLSLPEGLAFDIKESYILSVNSDGEIVGDTAVFSAFNDECEIAVMTGRVEDVQWAIDMYEKVSDNMSVFDDGLCVTVYAIKDGTSVTAFFENIPKEEIQAFMEQIMK